MPGILDWVQSKTMSSSDDDVVIVKRRRRIGESQEESGIVDAVELEPFDLMAAFGEDGNPGVGGVQLMKRCGGAEALWRATLRARKEGREIVGDELLRGNQAWRAGLSGIDFRFGYNNLDDENSGGVMPEDYLGRAGASKASMESSYGGGRGRRGRGGFKSSWRGRGGRRR